MTDETKPVAMRIRYTFDHPGLEPSKRATITRIDDEPLRASWLKRLWSAIQTLLGRSTP